MTHLAYWAGSHRAQSRTHTSAWVGRKTKQTRDSYQQIEKKKRRIACKSQLDPPWNRLQFRIGKMPEGLLLGLGFKKFFSSTYFSLLTFPNASMVFDRVWCLTRTATPCRLQISGGIISIQIWLEMKRNHDVGSWPPCWKSCRNSASDIPVAQQGGKGHKGDIAFIVIADVCNAITSQWRLPVKTGLERCWIISK